MNSLAEKRTSSCYDLFNLSLHDKTNNKLREPFFNVKRNHLNSEGTKRHSKKRFEHNTNAIRTSRRTEVRG